MKTECSDNGLASSSRGPWKTVRMMFYSQKYRKTVIAQQLSKMKKCLYAFSILSSRRIPVKPAVSYGNGKKERCCSDTISQLCYVVIVIPMPKPGQQLEFPPQPAYQQVKPLQINKLILSSH